METTDTAQYPLAFVHNGSSVYRVRKHTDNPASRILLYTFSFGPDEADTFDVRQLAGYDESCYALTYAFIQQALDRGVLRPRLALA